MTRPPASFSSALMPDGDGRVGTFSSFPPKMKPKKKQSREEILEKKRIAERKRKAKIRNDPVKLEELRKRERERYHRKKEAGLIVPLREMPARARRLKQKRNRINYRAYYQRQKSKRQNEILQKENLQKETIQLISTGNEITNLRTSPSILRRRSESPIPSTSMPQTLSQDMLHCRSRVLRSQKQLIKKSYGETSIDCFDIHSEPDRVDQLGKHCSTPINLPFFEPNTSPTVSSIHSPLESLEPNSPRSNVSTNSFTLRKELNYKLKTYQKQKSAEIKLLKQTIMKMQKEKELFRKRLERFKMNPIKQYLKAPSPKKKISPKQKQFRNLVKNFYEDDENSRLCPGKQDCITKHNLKKQKRFLTDSLKNLHQKYLDSGYPPISYITFTRLRPFWVVQPAINSRDTCLCKIHANMEFLISSLKTKKIINENSSTEVLKSLTCDDTRVECLQRKCKNCKRKVIHYNEFDNSNTIPYYTWERKTKSYVKDNKEKTTNIIEKIRRNDRPVTIVNLFEKELMPFMNHCANIKNQYKSFKTVKASLTNNECYVHIDFSENYSTKYTAEVQSVHFGGSRSQITLHTSVIYFKAGEETKTQSFCTVSTSLRHDASSVWAHLVPILSEVERLNPDVNTLHIVSDSPSGQYRNKKVYYTLSQLKSYIPKLECVVWHYCECGHGKGAPDGVGGVLKRSADQLVAYGNDITDIDSLVQHLRTAVKGVTIKIVHEHEIEEKDWLFPDKLTAFPGSMKVHQVIWSKSCSHTLAMRSLSCVDPFCLYNAVECCHGKHLGFYNLPTSITDQEKDDFSKEVTASSSFPYMKKKTCNKQPKPKIDRFRASQRFVLQKKSISKREVNPENEHSYYLEDLDYENMIPSSTFFENINSKMFSQFEKTTENVDETKIPGGKINTVEDTDSDEDLRVF